MEFPLFVATDSKSPALEFFLHKASSQTGTIFPSKLQIEKTKNLMAITKATQQRQSNNLLQALAGDDFRKVSSMLFSIFFSILAKDRKF
jgi:hypothetical protein